MYTILRDGKPVAETDNPLLWFHRNQSSSMHHALKWEGYSLLDSEGNPFDPYKPYN